MKLQIHAPVKRMSDEQILANIAKRKSEEAERLANGGMTNAERAAQAADDERRRQYFEMLDVAFNRRASR